MVLAVEPSFRLQGAGSLTVEELTLVTADGTERLMLNSRALRHLG